MSVDWEYFDRFKKVTDKYLPEIGEGNTKATQIVTAVSRLVYKWYNDGDIYDNTWCLEAGCNDLSSCANWLSQNMEKADLILQDIRFCENEGQYEDLLKWLANYALDEKVLEEYDKIPKVGSIYKCEGKYRIDEEYDKDYYG